MAESDVRISYVQFVLSRSPFAKPKNEHYTHITTLPLLTHVCRLNLKIVKSSHWHYVNVMHG